MEFRISREVLVGRQEAYDDFTLGERLSIWFTPEMELDLQVGGRYRNKEGDKGEILEINPGRLLRMSWDNENHAPGTEVTFTFEESNEGTLIAINHSQLKSEKDLKDLMQGWSWTLDNYKSWKESNKLIRWQTWKSNHSG